MDQSAQLDDWQQVDQDQVGLGALNFAGYEAQGGPATAAAGPPEDAPVPTGDTREINGIDLSLLDFGADSKDGKSDPSTETFEIYTEGSARRAKEELSTRLDIEGGDREGFFRAQNLGVAHDTPIAITGDIDDARPAIGGLV